MEGITRHSIHTIAKDLGYTLIEQPVSRDQLYLADEVFVVGTAAECIGLAEIDFRKIGNGRTGPITQSIQKVFHDAIRGNNEKYSDWVDYVNEDQVSVKVDQSTSVSVD